jgi:hypothetical protein
MSTDVQHKVAANAPVRQRLLAMLGSETAVVSETGFKVDGHDADKREATFEHAPRSYDFIVVFDSHQQFLGYTLTTHRKPADNKFLDDVTQTPLHLPVDGEWRVVWGGRALEQNAHALMAEQRFAVDFDIAPKDSDHQKDQHVASK